MNGFIWTGRTSVDIFGICTFDKATTGHTLILFNKNFNCEDGGMVHGKRDEEEIAAGRLSEFLHSQKNV